MRAVSRLALVALVTAGVTAGLASCTLLVDFEDVDAGRNDASLPDRDATIAEPDPGNNDNDASDGVDVSAPDTGIPFPPPCDPTFPRSQVMCNPSYPRPNCAKNTGIFPSYPAPRDEDLVTCNGGTTPPTCVQHCPFGCSAMPPGYPDACDDCYGRKDGTYCLKDFRGTDGRNLGLAVDCKSGKISATYNCGVGKCSTKCPRTDRSPSCCI